MEKKVKISPYTRLAIHTYLAIARMQVRLEKLRAELNFWVSRIPEEEVSYYLQKTNEIQREQDEKLENFMRRLGKKPWER